MKPKKKKVNPYVFMSKYSEWKMEGYNEACDDFEKWLPSEEEIETFLEKYSFPIMTETDEYGDNEKISREELAKAIKARLS